MAALKRNGPTEGRLLTADAIIFVGLKAEPVLEESLQRAGAAGLKLCDLGAALPQNRLMPHPTEPNNSNPYIWMDPDLWRSSVDHIVASLAELQPAAAADIDTRGHTSRFDLKNLAEYLSEMGSLIPAENRRLRTLNTGLHYLGRFIGLTVEHAKPERDSLDARILEGLQLDTLQPPGKKLIARTEPRDLSTYDGLLNYVTDLIVLILR